MDNALRIIKCESGGNPKAVGDGHLTFKRNGVEYGKSYSLFQIRHLPGRGILTEPEENIKKAAEIFKANGNRFGTTAGWYNCGKRLGIK